MNDARVIYSTAPDPETAAKIAEALLTHKLAACVNIHATMKSVYCWRGQIEKADEIPFLVKTSAALAAKASALIKELHPYECPCILSLTVDAQTSSADFLAWIDATTTA